MIDVNIALFSRSLGTDVADILTGGFQELGHRCRAQMFTLDPSSLNIVLPASLFPAAALPHVPPGTIFYNLESLAHVGPAYQAALLAILRAGKPVWDFGLQNRGWYADAGYADIPTYLPFGYAAAIDRLPRRPWAERPIDVMFFGSLSQRRLDILARLMASTLSVGIFANLYDAGRDDMISRAKIVVDIPSVAPFVAENPRLAFCASNGKLCVSERPSYPLPGLWEDAVTFVAYEELVATCEALVGDAEAALAREEQAYEAMRGMTMAKILNSALAGAAPRLADAS